MTLYHFGNCVALVYVPYYMAYKYSGLSEYGAFWKCVHAGGVYVFTQLCKMLVLATFFPDTDSPQSSGGLDLVGELLKATIDAADLVGLYAVLAGIPGKGHSKVLTAGMGWAGAEVILTRALLLWFGARGAEFDWKYIHRCAESNILLVQHVTTAALVWLWGRLDLPRKLLPPVLLMLAVTPYKSLLLELFVSLVALGPWTALAIKALVTLFFATFTLHIYSGLAQKLGIF